MLNREEVESVLRTTIEDRLLSRSEKKALKELIADWDPDDEGFAFLRNRAFEVARERTERHEDRLVLDWLEDVVRACVPRHREPADRAEACFSPEEDCPGRLISLFRNARKGVDVCVFTITDDRVSQAIVDAHRRGVRVRIIADDDKAWDKGSDIEGLERAGIPVRVDDSDAHMHHKFAIFDRELVVTGSYNWTRSAARENQENFVVVSDERLLRRFEGEFERLWRAFA